MGLFTSLVKTAVSVAILPIAVASDVANTLDGYEKESQTIQTLTTVKDTALDVVKKII